MKMGNGNSSLWFILITWDYELIRKLFYTKAAFCRSLCGDLNKLLMFLAILSLYLSIDILAETGIWYPFDKGELDEISTVACTFEIVYLIGEISAVGAPLLA